MLFCSDYNYNCFFPKKKEIAPKTDFYPTLINILILSWPLSLPLAFASTSVSVAVVAASACRMHRRSFFLPRWHGKRPLSAKSQPPRHTECTEPRFPVEAVFRTMLCACCLHKIALWIQLLLLQPYRLGKKGQTVHTMSKYALLSSENPVSFPRLFLRRLPTWQSGPWN